MPAGTLGFKLSGRVTKDEYFRIVEPIRAKLEAGEKVSFLVETDAGFDGLDAGALWEDAKAAGSMGLTLQPYWSPGVRVPGPEAKGPIIGFGDVHTRAHVYRAILEGLAYALRDGLDRIAARTGAERLDRAELDVDAGEVVELQRGDHGIHRVPAPAA